MSFTRSQQPVITEYELLDSPLKQICRQKDLGIVVTKDFNCMKQVQVITSKTTSNLGLIRRSASDTRTQQPCAKDLVPVHSAQQLRICQPGVSTSNCHRHIVNRTGLPLKGNGNKKFYCLI